MFPLLYETYYLLTLKKKKKVNLLNAEEIATFDLPTEHRNTGGPVPA